MEIKEVIKQLDELKFYCHPGADMEMRESAWRKNVEVLNIAIDTLRQVDKKSVEILGSMWINLGYHQQEVNRLKKEIDKLKGRETKAITEDKKDYKYDGGKLRLDLVPPGIIEAVGAIRTYGTEKYGENTNWEKVEVERYRAAMMRHLVDYLRDPLSLDEESGLPHLWHMACNIAFLIELDKGD